MFENFILKHFRKSFGSISPLGKLELSCKNQWGALVIPGSGRARQLVQ